MLVTSKLEELRQRLIKLYIVFLKRASKVGRPNGGYSNLGARGKNFQKSMLSEKKKRSDLGLDIFLPKSKCSLKKKKRSSLQIVH